MPEPFAGLRRLLGEATQDHPLPWQFAPIEGQEQDPWYLWDANEETIPDGEVPYGDLLAGLVNAAGPMLDALEAAMNLGANMSHRHDCEYRTKAKGWMPGQPPVIECVCGLDAFDAALSVLESAAAAEEEK